MLNWRTAPPLLIHLVAGASGFAAIAETFWVRDRLGLSATSLLVLAAWLTVPWTFLLALIVLLALLRLTVQGVPPETRRAMAAASLIIFAFRAMPSQGPALLR